MSSSMQSQDNHVSQFYNKILSTHGRGFSTSMASPTNPFTPRLLFPPKGEWSLHTRYKIIPQSQQNQENRPNTIRSNMLIHNTNNHNICQMQPQRFFQAHSYIYISNLHKMRVNMAWNTNLLSSLWLCKNGDEDLPSMASKTPSPILRCLYN